MSEPVSYQVRGPVAVLTMDKGPVNGLGAELRRVAAAGGSARPVLVKADASLTMQSFLEVCELARNAGFPGVLVAADER